MCGVHKVDFIDQGQIRVRQLPCDRVADVFIYRRVLDRFCIDHHNRAIRFKTLK